MRTVSFAAPCSPMRLHATLSLVHADPYWHMQVTIFDIRDTGNSKAPVIVGDLRVLDQVGHCSVSVSR